MRYLIKLKSISTMSNLKNLDITLHFERTRRACSLTIQLKN